MNERVNDLIKSIPDLKYDASTGLFETDRRALYDLIALTVNECLQQCEQVRNDAAVQKKSEFLTQDGKMLYEGVYGGATNCGFAIQQHFGVDE